MKRLLSTLINIEYIIRDQFLGFLFATRLKVHDPYINCDLLYSLSSTLTRCFLSKSADFLFMWSSGSKDVANLFDILTSMSFLKFDN